MWINRRAFDVLVEQHQQQVRDLRAESAYLRDQLAAAVAHNRRIERVDRGLHELEPQRRAAPADEHMPASVQRIVGLYDSAAARASIGSSIQAARARGESWDAIEALLKADLPEQIIEKLEGPNGG